MEPCDHACPVHCTCTSTCTLYRTCTCTCTVHVVPCSLTAVTLAPTMKKFFLHAPTLCTCVRCIHVHVGVHVYVRVVVHVHVHVLCACGWDRTCVLSHGESRVWYSGGYVQGRNGKKGSIGAIIRWNKTHLGCFKRDPTVLESMLYCPQRIFATSIDQMGSMWGPFVLFWDDNYSNYPYGSQVVSVWDIWAPPSPDKSQMGPIFSATWEMSNITTRDYY